jgi:hexosaminidase
VRNKNRLLVVLALMLLSLSCSTRVRHDINVIPKPVEVTAKDGEMLLRDPVSIFYQPDSQEIQETARELGESVTKVTALPMNVAPLTQGTQPGKGFYLALDNAIPQNEGYQLEIFPNEVKLSAREDAGLFYGVQTLKQLLFHAKPPQGGASCALPCLKIVDYPRFPWRGMHLDVSRHFYPKEFIKQYIDVLAMHKMNVFHWHLTDDHGWRIEIKHYPRLTEFGAWREPRDADSWLYDKNRSMDIKKRTYGGFYTQQDVREVIEYARQRHVTILPEIEMAGHAMAALDTYPELSCTGKPYLPPDPPITEFNEFTAPFCAGNEKTFVFLENVLSEVMELFPNPYIHVGGDEAKKTFWQACPKCQARMRTEGLKDIDQLQSYFMKRIGKFVSSKNRRMIGWDEILQGGLAPEAAVMSWRGEEGGIEAARQGHDVVMTPSEVTYFGIRHYLEPVKNGESALTSKLMQVYKYNPVPSGLTLDQARHVMGAQGCIWTEEVHTSREAMQTLLPSFCPLAGVVWTGPSQKDWADFDRRLKQHYWYLDFCRLDYFAAPSGGLSRSGI